MFSSSLRTALLALAASAAAVNAAKSLSLKVSGAESVNSVENLKITTTITNTGDEILQLLNDPLSPLSTLPANTFKISDSNGASPSFEGIMVKYVPARAAEAKAYTVLAPGQSIDVEHDLSTTYNFTKPGEGVYSIEARKVFYAVDSANQITEIHADSAVHKSRISGKLAVARPKASIAKRASYNGCSSSQQSALVSAAAAAETYAANARWHLSLYTYTSSRYSTWFGTYALRRHITVLSHFTNIDLNTFSFFTFDCTCTNSDVYAYVYPGDFGHIYLCGSFWSASTTGTDSQAGTIIHEASHFTLNGGTQDSVYGQTGAKDLAISNPDAAIQNADSHEYFAENNPSLS